MSLPVVDFFFFLRKKLFLSSDERHYIKSKEKLHYGISLSVYKFN